jgi:hypothetical protein
MIGKEKSYFHVIKHRKKALYRLLLLIGDGSMVSGHVKYIKAYMALNKKLTDIAYMFKSDDEFATWLCAKKIFTHKGNALNFVTVDMYNLDVTFNKFKKSRDIVRKFETVVEHVSRPKVV